MKVHDQKGKLSFYSNQITFNYNQLCHPVHFGITQYKQFPKKKKKKSPQEGKRKGKRDGKEEKKKKGWKEFVRKKGE